MTKQEIITKIKKNKNIIIPVGVGLGGIVIGGCMGAGIQYSIDKAHYTHHITTKITLINKVNKAEIKELDNKVNVKNDKLNGLRNKIQDLNQTIQDTQKTITQLENENEKLEEQLQVIEINLELDREVEEIEQEWDDDSFLDIEMDNLEENKKVWMNKILNDEIDDEVKEYIEGYRGKGGYDELIFKSIAKHLGKDKTRIAHDKILRTFGYETTTDGNNKFIKFINSKPWDETTDSKDTYKV